MDAKLNHSDLSALLAKEAGLSLAKAEMLKIGRASCRERVSVRV